jgi:biofilm PGA synthesis N-glycosyltransferase PgaC
VGNHTLTHASFTDNPDITNREQVIGNDHLMRGLANYGTRLFRLPEGNPQGNAVGLLQAQQLGYIHVDFDLDTEDWTYAPGQAIPTPNLDGKGHVVLMHDGGGDRTATAHMLENFIAEAKAQGYTFTTLQPLLAPSEVPQKDITPNADDLATVAVGASLTIVPDIVITWLFWFGIGSLSLMSILYVVLALISNARQRRKRWAVVGDEDLPFVSVVLPVYNEEAVVTKTLDALKASDYPAFEVVAVNDGSTDSTLAILQEYARSWPQLRVVHQQNGGKSAASNNAIAHSRGEIVVTLDGDTIFEPQTIRMFARHFLDDSRKKPLGAVAGHVKVGNRRNLLTAWQALEYISGICVTRMAEGAVGAISIVPGACAAWRREALVQAGGYSHDTLAEDSDLTLTIQSLGYSVVQENSAVAWTEAPMDLKGLGKQRLRWTYGNIQALYKHRRMLFNPRYGVLGLITLPYALISVLIPLVFMPMTFVVAGLILAQGQWMPIAIFAAFVAGAHLVISTVAVLMVRESPRHLLMVPIYRLIYEPLRAYVLYGSLLRVAKGQMVGWYRPERTNSVLVPAAGTQSVYSPQPSGRRLGKETVVPVLTTENQ